MTIAVTGATGHLGRLVIESLKARVPASDIVALARSPEKGADLGVSVREADYDRPETLDAALEGVDSLLLISASEVGKRIAQHRNVVEAAKKAGVRHIAYTSILHADTSPISLADEHRPTEAEIVASGIPYTFLRNGWYTENYAGAVASAPQVGGIYGAAGSGRISAATRADYAEAAAVVLTGEGHAGKTYELAGDDAFTLSDLAAEVSRQTGKDTPYTDLPQNEYAKALENAGLPAGLAETIAGWDVAASKGALFDDSRQLSTLIGRPTTPLSTGVAEMLK